MTGCPEGQQMTVQQNWTREESSCKTQRWSDNDEVGAVYRGLVGVFSAAPDGLTVTYS